MTKLLELLGMAVHGLKCMDASDYAFNSKYFNQPLALVLATARV